MVVGQVISGEFGRIVIRQKSDNNIELGEILVADTKDSKVLLQVYDLVYGSQISQQNLELISGLSLEENEEMKFLDPNLRNYKLAILKNLITIGKSSAASCKILPDFFSEVRAVTKEDLSFITVPKNPLFAGNLRSGSKMLDFPISLDGEDVLSHHVLIAATTGKGKSNLLSVMLWNAMNKEYAGFLVLDPHDEYYGRNKFGLKDNASKKICYYTPKEVPAGCSTLKINLSLIRPSHFDGAVNWSDAQKEALYAYHKKYGDKWIESIVLEKEAPQGFIEATIGVVRRRLMSILDLSSKDGKIVCSSIFDTQSGQTTISDIVSGLEKANVVVIDTSSFSGSVEILVGSMVSSAIFSRYKHYKYEGTLKDKPVISIILEEAPRVLGKEVLEAGSNIFSSIAREGRKFKIGLIAITQLPSSIPRTILANMNTKIIMGIEMAPERQAVIESASQDLSQDTRNIAALDKGEAIITSNFTRFALPVKIPLFTSYEKQKEKPVKKDLSELG
jgi:DNA helicase HerA-like ATPase